MLGRFWEAFGIKNGGENQFLGGFLFNVFLDCVLASILGGFLEPRNVTNQ